MRRVLLIGGAAALMAMPAAALAGQPAGEPATDTEPLADDAAGAATTTTDKSLHAEGDGVFRYEGSGGVALTGRGAVRVIDLSDAKDLTVAASGFGGPGTSKDGLTRRYSGNGTLTADGSSFRIVVSGHFTADVDDTATHGAAGQAKVAGRGTTILEGGIPIPFWANQRILITTGPMSVDLSGRGGPEWWRDSAKGPRGPKAVRKTVTVRKVVVGARGRRVVSERRVVTVRRWHWDNRAAGATWRLNGPASGTVDITTVTGRVRVWDRSGAKDLAVTVPDGTTTTTLPDGSVVYSGLKGAAVKLTGTGFRMKVRASDVEGTFTQADGTLARSFVRGKGTFTAGAATGVGPGRHGGVRVLLKPAVVAPK